MNGKNFLLNLIISSPFLRPKRKKKYWNKFWRQVEMWNIFCVPRYFDRWIPTTFGCASVQRHSQPHNVESNYKFYSLKKKTNDRSTNGGLMKLNPASMTAIKQVHKTENEKETFPWVTGTDNLMYIFFLHLMCVCWISFCDAYFCMFRRLHRKLGFDGHVKSPRVSMYHRNRFTHSVQFD